MQSEELCDKESEATAKQPRCGKYCCKKKTSSLSEVRKCEAAYVKYGLRAGQKNGHDYQHQQSCSTTNVPLSKQRIKVRKKNPKSRCFFASFEALPVGLPRGSRPEANILFGGNGKSWEPLIQHDK